MEPDEPSIRIDREVYDRLESRIDGDSTRDLTELAKQLGVPAPDGDYRWMVNRIFRHGTPAIAWSRSWRVVIDPVGFNWPYPDQSMEIDPELRRQLRAETKDMLWAADIAKHVISRGVAPPDDSGDWEVYVESMPGRTDGEQLIWYREADVVIVPSDDAAGAECSGDRS